MLPAAIGRSISRNIPLYRAKLSLPVIGLWAALTEADLDVASPVAHSQTAPRSNPAHTTYAASGRSTNAIPRHRRPARGYLPSATKRWLFKSIWTRSFGPGNIDQAHPFGEWMRSSSCGRVGGLYAADRGPCAVALANPRVCRVVLLLLHLPLGGNDRLLLAADDLKSQKEFQ